ncbi:hypothetical protein Mgra_00009762 [Meloidogyne graminicola]|uniref:Uncharacterized protein n=1 Tax=Meloidogyne graminicola TaxID=189291 RepID=A0A8S9ZBH1_9BILA|nr:hypothetical protein Mgra_00009762 [Meloidogyne graminicola]
MELNCIKLFIEIKINFTRNWFIHFQNIIKLLLFFGILQIIREYKNLYNCIGIVVCYQSMVTNPDLFENIKFSNEYEIPQGMGHRFCTSCIEKGNVKNFVNGKKVIWNGVKNIYTLPTLYLILNLILIFMATRWVIFIVLIKLAITSGKNKYETCPHNDFTCNKVVSDMAERPTKCTGFVLCYESMLTNHALDGVKYKVNTLYKIVKERPLVFVRSVLRMGNVRKVREG